MVSRPRGFTLIELLTVTAIIVIITLVLLLRQSKFDSSTILRSVAYSVALSVRQAQVYGTSVLGSSNGSAIAYAPGYGLFFGRTSPQIYILYADFNNNGGYDAGEAVQTFTLNAGYTISEACVNFSNGTKNCTGADDTTGSHTIDSVNIVFKRPNPDAVFNANPAYVSSYIQVRSNDGTTRSVLITSAGQINVQPPATLP